MPDVLVHRCTLRVVRRGGWSWGADPRRLLRRVLDSVPALVAAKLADALADVPDGREISQPIRIRIPVRLDDIRSPAAGGGTTEEMSRLLAERIGAAIDGALQTVEADRAPDVEVDRTPRLAVPPVQVPPAHTLREALLAWRASGVLGRVLAAAGEDVTGQWLRVLDPPSAFARAPSPVADRPEPHDGSGIAIDPAPSPRRASSQLLELAERLAAFEDDGPTDRSGAAEVAGSDSTPRALPAAPEEVAARVATRQAAPPPVARAAAVPRASLTAPEVPIAARRVPLIDAEVHVPSALPWLLIVALHRIGYLDVLRSALHLARLDDHAGIFAAALVYKLGRSAGRTWKKSAPTERLASAFAGVRDPVSKPALHRFARRAGPHLALPDGQLAHAIAAGQAEGEAWLVRRVGAGTASFAILDPQGMFPAWWAVDHVAVTEAVQATHARAVLVPESAAAPELLHRLTMQGVRFLTTARPGRGEEWVRLPSAPDAWWSNRPGPLTPAVAQAAATFGDLDARAAALCAEFTDVRVAMPLAPDSALERSVTLAVTVALGIIAWELWHAREATDPLLALTRFEDLDARVRFTPRAVRVVLPLGRRHRHLYEASLLTDVRDVPWLDGRTLEFSGG